jgi:poly(A) polymerase
MKISGAWLSEPNLQRVLAALELGGGQVRLVGGCVRDALAGRTIGDIDLATTLTPEAVTAAVQKAGLKAVPTGIEHGTVTVVCEGKPFEVTTLRRDVKTDGRHAEVVFTTDWKEDAARRDFTMNALSAAPDGEVFDYFSGVDDLKAGRVRFVGNPLHRIKEDVLRILRFFRFQAHFGQGEPDGAAIMACGMLVSLLPNLSRERVRTELLKLLVAPNPMPVWHLMMKGDVLKWLELPLGNIDRLERVVETEVALGVTDPLRRLWASGSDKADSQTLTAGLRLSNAEAERLRGLSQSLLMTGGDAGLRRLVYRHGLQRVCDALITQGSASKQQLAELAAWQKPTFPLTGRDLQAQGIDAGPRMGEILRHIEDWWIEQDFTPDKAACLARLKELT